MFAFEKSVLNLIVAHDPMYWFSRFRCRGAGTSNFDTLCSKIAEILVISWRTGIQFLVFCSKITENSAKNTFTSF